MTIEKINPKLRILVPVVKGLAKILGEDYEVNLHDLSIPERSLVLCENGHVTGRKPGGPMTDFGLFMMQSEEYRHKEGVFNYLTHNNAGELIRCSAIFIRDENDDTIAFLCVNYDMKKALTAQSMIEGLLRIDPVPVKEFRNTQSAAGKENGKRNINPTVKEWFAQDFDEVVNDAMSQIKQRNEKPLNYLSKPEKQKIVRELYDMGFFLLKGSVDTLAMEMGNTKYTIYSYIRDVQKQ